MTDINILVEVAFSLQMENVSGTPPTVNPQSNPNVNQQQSGGGIRQTMKNALPNATSKTAMGSAGIGSVIGGVAGLGMGAVGGIYKFFRRRNLEKNLANAGNEQSQQYYRDRLDKLNSSNSLATGLKWGGGIGTAVGGIAGVGAHAGGRWIRGKQPFSNNPNP